MLYLKQSTASQSVLIGPFIDDTDGKTAETGLTIANTDIRLSKNGGNMAAKTSGGGTHDEAGFYAITLDATDTDTVGRLQVSVDVAGALPVWAEFQVVEEDVYEFFYASGASPDADVAAILTRLPAALSGGNMKSDMLAISGDTAAADKLEESATSIVNSTAKAGTLSTTQMSTNLSETTNDHYIGRTVIWTTGALAGQASDITDYVGTNGVLTYSAVTEAPSAGDAFVIV